MLRARFGLVLVAVWMVGACRGAEVTEVTYRGWQCLRLANASTAVTVAPQLGGRIIQYAVDGHEFLYVNSTLAGQVHAARAEDVGTWEWRNYGGDKLWPAPQGWGAADLWPGPAGMIEDQVPFAAEIAQTRGTAVEVKLTGPATPNRSGLRFSRSLRLEDGSSVLRISSTMKNVTDRPVTWGLWAVTQLDVDGEDGRPRAGLRVVAPVSAESRFPRGFDTMFGQVNHPGFTVDRERGLFVATFHDLVGKAGLDTREGWAAFVDDAAGMAFVQRFTFNPGATYPDGTSFTVWLNAPGAFIAGGEMVTLEEDPAVTPRYLEMEIVSPLVRLEPGEVYTARTSWESVRGDLAAVVRQCCASRQP